MDAFDADVLVYASADGHDLGRRVRALFRAAGEALAGVGSVLLIPEALTKPMRTEDEAGVADLLSLLARLDLRPVDRATAELATTLAAGYGLRAADAIHLATAVAAGADRFITNNRKDFRKSIEEVDVTYPDELPA